jgi:hypothetical protein
MEPMHIYALLHLKNAEEDRRNRLEQYFVVKAHVRTVRRERVRRLRRRLTGRNTPQPNTVELAVQ